MKQLGARRARYRSLTRQTLHYFVRPHERVLREPLRSPAAWRGPPADPWRIELTGPQRDALRRAVDAARRVPIAEMAAEDMPIPELEGPLQGWRRELTAGRGFVLIRGVPVEEWSSEDRERFFWGFGLHLGVPGAQNPRGDLLGHVRDEGQQGGPVRAYRTAGSIAYHCDAADVVGLLCLQNSSAGGRSRIASSVAVYNELLRRRPGRIARLFRPFWFDTFGEGGIRCFPVAPCRYAAGRLRTFYHSDYFRSVQRYPGRELDPQDLALLDEYEEIASDPALYLEMDLEPGDVQLLSNHTQIHSRTAYRDEPGRKRHLLRLWLSLEEPQPLRERLLRWRSAAGLAAVLARARLAGALAGRAQVDGPRSPP